MTRSSYPAENFPAPDAEHDDAPLGRIVRNSAFNAIGTVLIVPSNMLALFIMARRLGTQPVGTFFTIFAISAVIHWIADAGTTTVLTRRVSRYPERLKEIVAEATGILPVVCLASALMFFVVSSGWMLWNTGDISLSVVLVAAAAMASRHALDFAANVLRGLERFEFENLTRVVQTMSFCVFVWLWVYPETGGALAAFIAFAASNFIAAALIWAVLLLKWQCAGFRLSRAILRDWLTESIPLGVGDVVRQVLMQMDTLLLAAFKPQAVVGLFSIAARPLQPLQLLPRIIVSVTFPTMARTAHLDRESFSRMFAKTTSILWAAALPISIAVSMCATPMLLATAGPKFADAARPLQILIWTTGLIFINAQLRFVLTALDAEQKYWRLITRVLVAKIALAAILIPLWGLYGACAANFLGEAILCVGGMRVLNRLEVYGPAVSQLLRTVPAGIAMALVLWPFTGDESGLVTLAVAGAASGLVYAVVSLACGVLPWSDVRRVWRTIRRPMSPAARETALLATATDADVSPG
ncbi:MAG: oligosaccharide flippase family protein [Pirellulales bacterium]|nr:oligosaccharide flippase family protein [Pirellulales bacterium]